MNVKRQRGELGLKQCSSLAKSKGECQREEKKKKGKSAAKKKKVYQVSPPPPPTSKLTNHSSPLLTNRAQGQARAATSALPPPQDTQTGEKCWPPDNLLQSGRAPRGQMGEWPSATWLPFLPCRSVFRLAGCTHVVRTTTPSCYMQPYTFGRPAFGERKSRSYRFRSSMEGRETWHR